MRCLDVAVTSCQAKSPSPDEMRGLKGAASRRCVGAGEKLHQLMSRCGVEVGEGRRSAWPVQRQGTPVPHDAVAPTVRMEGFSGQGRS